MGNSETGQGSLTHSYFYLASKYIQCVLAQCARSWRHRLDQLWLWRKETQRCSLVLSRREAQASSTGGGRTPRCLRCCDSYTSIIGSTSQLLLSHNNLPKNATFILNHKNWHKFETSKTFPLTGSIVLAVQRAAWGCWEVTLCGSAGGRWW